MHCVPSYGRCRPRYNSLAGEPGMTERFGVDCLYDRAEKPVAVLLLAHGAGAAMDSDFMNTMAAALASHSVAVLRFEFPYMQRRRDEQRQFPPDRAPKLLAAFAERVREARSLAAELSEIPDGALQLGDSDSGEGGFPAPGELSVCRAFVVGYIGRFLAS